MTYDVCTPEQIQDFILQNPVWVYDGHHLQARYVFPSFARAFAVLSQIAILCEKQNHHPDINWSYHRLSFCLTTHDAGHVVTRADMDLAQAIDSVCSSFVA